MSGEGAPAPTASESQNEAAVGVVLDTMKSTKHRYGIPVLVGLMLLFDSWDSIAIAYAMPALSADWKLDPLVMGFAISGGYLGQFIGAATLGAVAERVGRLPVILVAMLLMSLLAVGCAFAPGFNSLLIMRFVQGIMIGGAMPVAITYINELAPSQVRGRYFGLFQTLAISGFGIASLSSPWVVPTLGWRWMLGLGAAPLLLLPIAFMILPESPRWLVRKGRLEDANQALVRLGGRPADFTAAPQAPSGTVTAAIRKPNLFTLFGPDLRSRTITVSMLWFLTMFVSFGLTTWVPSIYVKVFGIPQARALTYSAVTSMMIIGALSVTGALIDRYGRKPFAMGGLVVTTVALTIVGFFRPSHELALVALVMTGQVAIFFPAFMVWPYTAETFPTQVRALALGYSSSLGRAATAVSPIFVGFVLSTGAQIGIVFASFGLFALLALMVWMMRTQETVGTRLENL